MTTAQWGRRLSGAARVFLLLLSTVLANENTHPSQCRLSVEEIGVTAVGHEGLRASCSVRVLRPELLQPSSQENNSLSALNRSLQVTSLHIQCAKQVVFESELDPASFVTFPRLQELSIESCKLKELPDRVFAGLSQLRQLSVLTHHRDWPGAALTINRETLSELPRLERLDLSASQLWQLPEGALCSLASLNTVNLTLNRLHRLADLGIDIGCQAPISHLLLSHNELDELPAHSLPTPHLHTLHVDHNKLARIDDHAFSRLSELRELILSFNRLVALPQTAFADLYQLRSLDLSNNSLSAFPPSLFTSLQQLLALNLSYNYLSFSYDNPEPFTGLIRLVVLDLSHNNLNDFGAHVFSQLYSLQALFLPNNKITHLNTSLFAKLANLYTLDLSNNKLMYLETGALQGLSVLTHFYADNNDIESIADNVFFNCSSLQKLTLSHNHLARIPKAVTYLSLLQELDLSHNEIDILQRSNLKGLNNLKHLSFSNNFIGNISVGTIPRLPHLQYLDLSHNQIAGVEPGSLESLTALEMLNISHNSLSDINGLALPLPNLLYLNVSHNHMKWFDFALVPRTMKVLDMSYNSLRVLENHYEVHDKLNLKTIIASNNNITTINALSIPNRIEMIDFSNNLIDYVSTNTFLLKDRVSVINLEGNLLTLLEESSLRLPPRSPDASSASPPLLLLSDNPLKCDCGAEWLSRAAKDNTDDKGSVIPLRSGSLLPRLGKISDVRCTLPGLWQEVAVALVAVHQHQFLCTYRRHCFTLCHCCDFDACDCEQTCPDNCSCYHDHTWSHNIVDCGNQNWTVMPLGVPMDVTEAYLDGNNMGNLTSHALIGRKNLRVLYLNNSRIIDIQNRTFNGLRNLQILRLDHNHLQALHGYEFTLLHNLIQLYVNDNEILFIANTTFTSLRSLEVLRLENNRISIFPVWNLALNPFIIEVGLYDNRWSCECNFLANLKSWLESNRIKTINANEMNCFHNSTGIQGPLILSNSPGHCDLFVSSKSMDSLVVHDYILFVSISAGVLLVISLFVFLAVAYRRRIKMWASSHYSKQLFEKSSSYMEEHEKLFDVFISHSSKDSVWVYGVLVPELETRGYRTCAGYRNCSSPTAPIVAQAVMEGISCSQKLLIVLSRGLVDCEWCKYDFKSTHVEAVKCLSKKQLILVYLEDIPKFEFDSEMVALVKKASYHLKPRNPKYWDQLRKALPSLRHRARYDDVPGNKSVSSPLVSSDLQQDDLTKFSCHPAKNLRLNPFWETAISSDIPEWNMKKPDLGAPPWVAEIDTKKCVSPVTTVLNRHLDGDHTYMSVSEYGDHATASIMEGVEIFNPGPSSSPTNDNINSPTPMLNGTTVKYSVGHSSPPLLPLHHQQNVQNRVLHYQESPQYQTPHTLQPSHQKRHLGPVNTQTLHTGANVNRNNIVNANFFDNKNNQDSRTNSPKTLEACEMDVRKCNDYSNNLDLEARRIRKDGSSGPKNFEGGDYEPRDGWVYQTPVNLPNSNCGQTYYV